MPPPSKSKLLTPEYIAEVKATCAHRGLLLDLFAEMTMVRGKMASCPFHEDRRPSVSVTADQGLWKCHECDRKGTAIDLLMLAREMNFRDAVLYLADRLAIPRPDDTTEDAARRREVVKREVKQFVLDKPAEEPLSWDDQFAAYQGFMDAINEVDGAAEENGRKWLAEKRGIPCAIQDRCGRFVLLTAKVSRQVHDMLRGSDQRDLFQAAGILGATSQSLTWYDDTVLLFATDPEREHVVHLRGRQLAANVVSRYLAPHTHGAMINGVLRKPRQVMFGLPQALEAARTKRPLLIVEGAIKAMGAVLHGFHAIAINNTPGFQDAASVDGQAQARMLTDVMKYLRGVEVIVVPDYEQNWENRSPEYQAVRRAEYEEKDKKHTPEWDSPPKRLVGLQKAWELARWLAAHGIKASAQEIPDLIGPGKVGLIGDRWIKDWDEIE